MKLVGHLDVAQLKVAIAKADELLVGDDLRLLVDCAEMGDYDKDARELFTSWNAETRSRISKVAIVTDRKLWHMIVHAMAFASRQVMRPFGELNEAYAWLEE